MVTATGAQTIEPGAARRSREGDEAMKIYTGVGDRGNTSLFSGERVPKSDARIEAYGDVDELGSVIGALIAGLDRDTADLAEELKQVQSALLRVGAFLATTPGSPAMAHLTRIGKQDIGALEASIDRQQEALPTLSAFVLPGGTPAAAWAHLSRVVCRRAERKVVALGRATEMLSGQESSAGGRSGEPEVNTGSDPGSAADGSSEPRAPLDAGSIDQAVPHDADSNDQAALIDVLVYLNRLSDYLFVLARTCNRRAGVGDQVWEKA